MDRELVEVTGLVFSEIVFQMREDTVRWSSVMDRARKIGTALRIHAQRRGRVEADEVVERLVGDLVRAVVRSARERS